MFSADVEDEVYANSFYSDGLPDRSPPTGATEPPQDVGQGDRMGHERKDLADRQEIQIYLRDN